MKKSVRRTLGMLLTVVFGLGGVIASMPETVHAATSSTVQLRTQEEIANYYNTHYFSIRTNSVLEQNPDVSRNLPGELSMNSVQEALNALNLVRYVAGLNEVGISEEYQTLAQHGAALLETAGVLCHNPGIPSGMGDGFYQKGLKATSSSNLASGYAGLPLAIIDGWLDDTNPRTVTELGHRRWILDPGMESTGFGKAGDYSLMYAYDGYRQGGFGANYIPWPATNTPSQLFAGNWSVLLNPDQYGPSNDINVYITDEATQRTTRFYRSDKEEFLYDYRDGGKYGRANAIIFEPGVSTDVGKSYRVRITGLKNRSGQSVEDIEYDVRFFNIENIGSNASIFVPENERDYNYTPSEWEMIRGNTILVSTSSNAISSGTFQNKWTDYGNYEYSNGGSSSNSGGSSTNSGGSSSGSGGSSSGSANRIYTNTSGMNTALSTQSGNINLTPEGEWVGDNTGRWGFLSKNGYFLKDTWFKIHNPYSPSKKQAWFRFDEIERMQTGWFTSADGRTYYLNPHSDGTKGEMLTGWQWIEKDGAVKCYYFSEEQNEFEGHLLKGATVDGWTVNEHGEWTLDGKVMTKELWDSMKNSESFVTKPSVEAGVQSESAVQTSDALNPTLQAETGETTTGSTNAKSDEHVKVGPTVPMTLAPETIAEGMTGNVEASDAKTETADASVSDTKAANAEAQSETIVPNPTLSADTGESKLQTKQEVILSSRPVTSGVKRYIQH